ncbi:LAGLIDADG family homing endonuclease [Nocardiopsis terrae]
MLGAYLGDGHITVNKHRSGLHTLWIFYDNKYPQLISYCTAAIEAVLPIKVFMAKRPGCTEVHSNWKHWPCLFPQHGPGKKHDRIIALEPWQQVIVEEHPKNFVRGSIHSDGSRVLNRIKRKHPDGYERYYEYPRYHFTNTSKDIIGILNRALDRLDIPWEVHTSKGKGTHQDKHVVSISRKDAVARMDEFVGPKY